MNKKIISVFSIVAIAVSAQAAATDISRVLGAKIDRSTDRLLVNMTIDADDLGKKSNRESWLTPVLTDTAPDGTVNSTRMPSVLVAGRSRYYQALRHGVKEPVYRGGVIDYEAAVEWQPWMETATLSLERRECGCCGTDTITTGSTITKLDFVEPTMQAQFPYVQPPAEKIKLRELKGRAFIDFPVNSVEIKPDYRSNPRELGVIRATIDSVRVDPDVHVQLITFEGFASPEGPYKNNIRLAKGRTEALCSYVQNLYHFDKSVIQTSWVPEDWDGLRRFMETSGLENRDAIIDIIDSDLEPDTKDQKIRRRFPEQYAFLLKEVYPALRHTDYTINYVIRSFSDPREIIALVYKNPSKLSLNEFFLAAKSVPEGSPEYNYIFETAARMYPEDETANLNAANAAMQQGSWENAETYLKKAGDSPEAVYARGLLQAFTGNYEAAKPLLVKALHLGVKGAGDALDRIAAIENYSTVKIVQ